MASDLKVIEETTYAFQHRKTCAARASQKEKAYLNPTTFNSFLYRVIDPRGDSAVSTGRQMITVNAKPTKFLSPADINLHIFRLKKN